MTKLSKRTRRKLCPVCQLRPRSDAAALCGPCSVSLFNSCDEVIDAAIWAAQRTRFYERMKQRKPRQVSIAVREDRLWDLMTRLEDAIQGRKR